jgi:hypothetical protein
MSAFSSWDTYNIIAEHIIEALQTDTELATSGSLEIQTWEAETRETSSEYNDNELPAVAVEVVHSSGEINPLSKLQRGEYSAVVLVTTGGQAVLETVKQQAKRIAARVERVLRQQNRPSKQLEDVTTDLEGAFADSVTVTNVATLNDGGVVNNVLRGAAAITCEIQIDFIPTID